MVKPVERYQRPSNPIQPNIGDAAFQAAVRRALAARAAAEGRPPESHGYETAGVVQPGDALLQLVGAKGVADNGQFSDPNSVNPGEIYFKPGQSPVSAQTEGTIDAALTYDRAHPDGPDSQRNWEAVETAIAGELRQSIPRDAKGNLQIDANGNLQLTADQQAKLQALNAWAVGTDRLSVEAKAALDQVNGEVIKQSRDTTLDQTIASVQKNLDQVKHKLDDQSFIRKGWGWITPGKSSGEKFRDFLQDKLDDLKEVKAGDTGLPQDQYQQKLNAVLGDFDEQFKKHAEAMADSDKTWNTIGEVGRVVAATTVGIVTTAATGGNVAAGFAVGFGTYQLIDTVGDVKAVVQGQDMYADGHTSLIGFGMDAVGLDGAKGDGAGVTWDHAKAAMKDTAIDAVSSLTTAGATAAGIKTTAAVTARLGSTALPNLGTRVIATAAGGTVGQGVNGAGQLTTDATRLAFDNKLFTAEGGQQMLHSAETQGLYLATAPVTGAVSGAIPVQKAVGTAETAGGSAATGTTRAAQQGAAQAAEAVPDATRLSRLGMAAQFGNDLVTNFGGAELVARVTEGRDMNKDEMISAAMGSLPGTAMNVAMHPQTTKAIETRRDMLEASGGTRKEGIPDLWFWQKKGPEVRLGVQARILGNADPVTGLVDGAPKLGQPTLASAGAAVSSKTNFKAIGQSVLDSLVSGSTRPLRLTLGKELTVSQRPREYRNITMKEAGLMPTSNQTVFQIKGSTVLKQGEKVLFATDPAEVKADFAPVLKGVSDVGSTSGGGHVVELSWGAALPEAPKVTLAEGEMDLFGTVAGKDADAGAFVEVPRDISFTKMMEEQKVGIRPRAWTNYVPVLGKLMRLGAERRPEDNITVTIPKGTKLSQQAWDQMQATYGRLTMRTRIVVDDATQHLLLNSDPDLTAIQDLVALGYIDPATKVSYVPGRASGMRLSAVTGKPAEVYLDLHTGKEFEWHPDAANADFIFNDRYPTEAIPGLPDSLPNPDQIRANAAYKLPNQLGGGGGDPPHRVAAVPSEVNLYRRLAGPKASFVAEATRYTASIKLPTVLSLLKPLLPSKVTQFIPADLSIEFRGQVKVDPTGKSKDTPRGVSKAVQSSGTILKTYGGGDGSYKQLPVPGWLDSFLKWSEQGQGVLFPEGGVHAMKQYLDDLDAQAATPEQRQGIADFRRDVLPKLGNETLTTPATAEAIRRFLEGQAKPVGTSVPNNPMPRWMDGNRRSAGGAG